MSSVDDSEFQRLNELFLSLTKSQRIINEYKTGIIRTFNGLLAYLTPVHEAGSLEQKLQLNIEIVGKILLLFRLFGSVQIESGWMQLFSQCLRIVKPTAKQWSFRNNRMQCTT